MRKMINRLMIMRRKLVRALLLLVHDPAYKSKADYWPWVKIVQTEPSSYRISYAGRSVCTTLPFSQLQPAHDEMAIIGSGPSVNDMSLDLVAEMDCVLLNGSISLIRTHGIRPLASIIVDSTFIENRFDALADIPTGSNMIVTAGVIRAISERNPSFLKKMNVFLTQYIHAPNYIPGPQFNEQQALAMNSWLSSDLNCGFIGGGTVMATAIQLAHYLKVKQTYLIGLDISNAASPRFNETQQDKLKCGLLLDYERNILPFMTAAARLFAESGLEIYNCSHISRLPYDVIPYSDRFRK